MAENYRIGIVLNLHDKMTAALEKINKQVLKTEATAKRLNKATISPTVKLNDQISQPLKTIEGKMQNLGRSIVLSSGAIGYANGKIFAGTVYKQNAEKDAKSQDATRKSLDKLTQAVYSANSLTNQSSSGPYLLASKHASGGILTRPHLGMVAEAGPEAIIPLSNGRRSSAKKLWQQTGQILGVPMHADGGFFGKLALLSIGKNIGTQIAGDRITNQKHDIVSGTLAAANVASGIMSDFSEYGIFKHYSKKYAYSKWGAKARKLFHRSYGQYDHYQNTLTKLSRVAKYAGKTVGDIPILSLLGSSKVAIPILALGSSKVARNAKKTIISLARNFPKLSVAGKIAGKAVGRVPILAIASEGYDIYKAEDKKKAVWQSAASLSVGMAGAIIGQALIPIPGVGAMIGGAVGGLAGAYAKKYVGDYFDAKDKKEFLLKSADGLTGAAIGAVFGGYPGAKLGSKLARKYMGKAYDSYKKDKKRFKWLSEASMAGGIAGASVGAAVGQVLIPIPGVGAAIGAIAGGVIAGAATKYFMSKAYDKEKAKRNKRNKIIKHAAGGLLTRPHLGLVAEAGPEVIIPLSPRMRNRSLALWQETGKMLGIKPYADGGFAGLIDNTRSVSGLNRTNNKEQGGNINVSVTGMKVNMTNNVDEDELALKIGRKILQSVKQAAENKAS